MEKKVNKKAIAGILAAMVLSLGTLSGISQSNVKNNEANKQQMYVGVSAAMSYYQCDWETSAAVGVAGVAEGLMMGALFGGLVGALVGL